MGNFDRVFQYENKPKGNRLAVEILDPRYYRDFNAFVERICDFLWQKHQLKSHTGTVEGIVRDWADAANFKPETDLEQRVHEVLEFYVTRHQGWKAVGIIESREDDIDG